MVGNTKEPSMAEEEQRRWNVTGRKAAERSRTRSSGSGSGPSKQPVEETHIWQVCKSIASEIFNSIWLWTGIQRSRAWQEKNKGAEMWPDAQPRLQAITSVRHLYAVTFYLLNHKSYFFAFTHRWNIFSLKLFNGTPFSRCIFYFSSRGIKLWFAEFTWLW